MINTTTATTAELLAFFNANTGGAQVKKFADRKTAERRVNALLEEMAEEAPLEGLAHPDNIAAAEREIAARALEGEDMSNAVVDPVTSAINFIRTEANDFASVTEEQHAEHRVETNHYVRPSGMPITQRPAMSASLKLDRQILSVNSGIVYKNACQVWKSGLVSSSQCDRLSAVLYGAAKQGNRLMSVTINGHIFALAVK